MSLSPSEAVETDSDSQLASVDQDNAPTAAGSDVERKSETRTGSRWTRSFIHTTRRLHLYMGLLLIPWALLYGVSGFLFNHPSAFSGQTNVAFGPEALEDTPMQTPPSPGDVAAEVVAALQERAPAEAVYRLVRPEEARFARDTALVNVQSDGGQVTLLLDLAGRGGSIRSRPAPADAAREEKAPFAVTGTGAGGKGQKGGKGGAPKMGRPGEGNVLKVANPVHERVRASAATVLERTNSTRGEPTVGNFPDLTFLMEADGKLWTVVYNSLAGSVRGRLADTTSSDALSSRQFLTRLHTTHGYSSSLDAKSFWAVIVDVMAFVMVFWAASGLVMWWQLRTQRTIGLLLIVASIAAATALGMGMHELLTR